MGEQTNVSPILLSSPHVNDVEELGQQGTTPTRQCSAPCGKQPVVRAIEASHTACKYGFRPNPRSQSCVFFNFIYSKHPGGGTPLVHGEPGVGRVWMMRGDRTRRARDGGTHPNTSRCRRTPHQPCDFRISVASSSSISQAQPTRASIGVHYFFGGP